MTDRPQFKNCFHVEVIESVGVFLLSESDYFVLAGRLYEQLAPLLDGSRTTEEIIEHLEGTAKAAEVYYALMLMERKGYLIESDESMPPEIAAFWEILKVDPQVAKRQLQSTTVSVTSFGSVATEPLISILESLDIRVGKEGDFAVVLTDDYLQPGLAEFNRQALESKRPWMLIKPTGTIIWIGPIFHPEKTGCWECLTQRIRSNRPVETFIQKQKGFSQPLPTGFAGFGATRQAGLNLAANAIAQWIAKREHESLEGKLISFDTTSVKTQSHVLVKRPQCPECGDRHYRPDSPPVPIVLESRKKTFTADGGHRSSSPEETIAKYEHHISTITGAVRELRRQRSLENNLTPIYVAGHNFATMFDSLYFLRENLRGRSGGKGKSEAQAKASALCEALERYSGVFQGYETRHKGTCKQMGTAAIHPNACMHFSDRQYQTRDEWNASCDSLFQKVTDPFDEELEIEWTPVWSLTHQDWKLLPTAYCYYGYEPREPRFCMADSNGAAAGNTKEEAILQGFMELAERDSVSIWWYNRIKRPGVDLESFNEPYFQALKHYYQTLNRELWVLDLTIDLNIPAFAALSRRTDKAVEDILYGFGAHFDPKIAIMRALTEVNQTLPGVISVAADGSTQYSFPDQLALDWWQKATCENQPYVVPDNSVPLKMASDYPQLASDDLLEDVRTCTNIAQKLGMETLVLDQTRPDLGLNVVKVIVPEMRIFWKRWGPGRLYEVPVKLGWLPEPLPEEQLNPFPIFF